MPQMKAIKSPSSQTPDFVARGHLHLYPRTTSSTLGTQILPIKRNKPQALHNLPVVKVTHLRGQPMVADPCGLLTKPEGLDGCFRDGTYETLQ